MKAYLELLEMPAKCDNCMFMYYRYRSYPEHAPMMCWILGKYCWDTRRLPDCPLKLIEDWIKEE